MNTPLSIAELLKRSTRGPFIYRGDVNAIMAQYNILLAMVPQADGELICRLLAFVHAGGAEFLAESIRFGSPSYAKLNEGDRLLAILNGKKDL